MITQAKIAKLSIAFYIVCLLTIGICIWATVAGVSYTPLVTVAWALLCMYVGHQRNEFRDLWHTEVMRGIRETQRETYRIRHYGMHWKVFAVIDGKAVHVSGASDRDTALFGRRVESMSGRTAWIERSFDHEPMQDNIPAVGLGS